MERNEMKICSLQNENLQFTKWQFTFSLHLLGYPKQKIATKKSCFAHAECVMLSLPHIKFNLGSGVFERRTATRSKTSSLFICLDTTTLLLQRRSTWKFASEPLPKNAKSPLPVPVETPYLNQKRHAIFKRTDKIYHCGFVVYFRTWWF